MVRTIRVVIELAEGGPTAREVVAVVVLVHHPTPPQSRFLNSGGGSASREGEVGDAGVGK